MPRRTGELRAQELLDRRLASRPREGAGAVRQAFDEAWNSIAPQSAGDPDETARMRLKLAECIIAVAPNGETDVEQIKSMALQMLWILERQGHSP